MLIPRGNAIYRFFLSAIFPSPSPLFARQLISPTNRVSAKIPVERNNKRSSSNPREPWNVRLFQSYSFYVFQNMFRLLSKKRSRASVFFYIDGGKSRFAKLFNRLCNRSVRLEICLIGRKENVVLNRGEERFKFRFCFNRSRFDLGSIFFFFFLPFAHFFLSRTDIYRSPRGMYHLWFPIFQQRSQRSFETYYYHSFETSLSRFIYLSKRARR